MDYSICKAASFHSNGLQELLVIYDIACQWCINFLKRLERSPGLTLPSSFDRNKLLYAVGKFHLRAHVDNCFPRFTLNYLAGSAQIDGELMETAWSFIKPAISSTRSMSLQHRQEAIDHQIREYNWRKAISSGLHYFMGLNIN